MTRRKALAIASGYTCSDQIYKRLLRPLLLKYLGIDLSEPIWDHIDHDLVSSHGKMYCRTCKHHI